MAIECEKRRCKRCHRIAVMFGRLEDWRRVATRLTTAELSFLCRMLISWHSAAGQR